MIQKQYSKTVSHEREIYWTPPPFQNLLFLTSSRELNLLCQCTCLFEGPDAILASIYGSSVFVVIVILVKSYDLLSRPCFLVLDNV